MRRARYVLVAAVALAGCGADRGHPVATVGSANAGRPVLLVAALGDSITAGTPLWDPDPAVRSQIGAQLDRRSQWEYWFVRAHPGVQVRNCGVNGQTTAEIALRLDACARGARVLIVQGGINDIARGQSVADAARNLAGMVARGRQLGLKVAMVQLLPWNNGYPAAAPLVRDLNRRIAAIGRRFRVPVYPWFRTLEDHAAPDRMRADLTIEGNHPSVAGYRRLAATIRLP